MKNLVLVIFFMSLINSIFGQETYITDVIAVSENIQYNLEQDIKKWEKKGYTKLDMDLNKDAKGHTIYLMYKTTTNKKESRYIKNFLGWSKDDDYKTSVESYLRDDLVKTTTGNVCDFNKGAGGNYIYLAPLYTDDHLLALKRIEAQRGGSLKRGNMTPIFENDSSMKRLDFNDDVSLAWDPSIYIYIAR